MIRFLISTVLLSMCFCASSQNYQLYMRLTDNNGVMPGPVASLTGVAGTNFYPVGCSEHQFASSGAALANHSPYLITHPFYPFTSPLLRQHLHAGTSFTVELFYMQDNGGTLTPFFGVTLQNAFLRGVTTAADSNALQETLSFEYGQIIWHDLVNNQSLGWDLVLNQPI